MINKKVAILAGTMARAEDLRRELGIDAYTLTTRGGMLGARGMPRGTVILVDGTSRWGEDVRAMLAPIASRVYWIDPVEV